MKKIAFLVLMAAALWTGSARAQAPWLAAKTDNAVYAELKKHFINLININTAQPQGNELAAARYIYGVLEDEHIDWEIYQSTAGRAAVAGFLRAPERTGQKPLLLVSHLDTVSADPARWKTPPFTAVEKNGEIYGRGASDCKDLTAINLMTLLSLKRSGARLTRDVILLATPDEEAGSAYGMKWLLEKHRDRFAEGFALNEGGGIITDNAGRPLLVFVETAGKMYLDLKLTASGPSGHAAIPPRVNAIYQLGGALSALDRLRLPLRVTPSAGKFFRAIYPLQSQDGKTTFDLLFSSDAQKTAAAAEAIAADPFFNTQLRDTITPTVLRAGQDNNTVPAEAEAVLNCRLLYDANADEFVETVRRAVAPFGVKVSVLESPRLPFPAAQGQDDELYKTITAASALRMPGVTVAGGMIPGTTDSEFLRRAGIVAYGLGAPKSYGELNEPHSDDEKIKLESFYRYFDFVYAVAGEFSVRAPASVQPAADGVKSSTGALQAAPIR